MKTQVSRLGVAVSLAILASHAYAQCVPFGWSTVTNSPFLASAASAVEWDPDGAGVRTPVLAIGGDFNENILCWDPSTGNFTSDVSLINDPNQPVNPGGFVEAVAVYHGDLYAAGRFSVAFSPGGQFLNNIARWSGTAWVPLGSAAPGVDGDVFALTVWNDQLIVCGSFTHAGGAYSPAVAAWNGQNWIPLGSTFDDSNQPIALSAVSYESDLVIAGLLDVTGSIGTPSGTAGRWNGSAWTQMGTSQDVGGHIAVWDGTLYSAGGRTFSRFVDGSWVDIFPPSLPTSGLITVYRGSLILAGGFEGAAVDDPTRNEPLLRAVGAVQWDGRGFRLMDTDPNVFYENGPQSCIFASSNGYLYAFGTSDSPEVHGFRGWGKWTFGEKPWIARQPVEAVELDPSQTLTLTAKIATGAVGVSYQWYRDNVALTNGQGAGGVVAGAAGSMPSPSIDQPITLTVSGVKQSDAGSYTVRFSNTCNGTPTVVDSLGATVTVTCRADFNNDGFIVFEDFDGFVSAYELGLSSADFNGDGFIDFIDFDAFVAAFEYGC
ncbi:MAG: hypothetical protein SFY96_09515 [Planctomycetota bacterium]|nr:hypothetical protein [Planctomycetota bacterium]